MPPQDLGRLERVDLREVWESEAGHFTPWLARDENLRLLAQTIEMDLEMDSTEKSVGPFRADILCRDTATDRWVLIENQLERTDHTHLGQILTYAAGLDAVTIVWVAERFTEEHRAALDWLNEHTDDSINCFGLEVELWRIGNSAIAPKFNVVCKPNDWSRTVQAAAGGGELTEHKQAQLRFWTNFKGYMEEAGSVIRCQKPSPQHWTNHPLGRAGAHLTSVVSAWNSLSGTWSPEIRAEVTLDGPNAKAEFAELEERKAEIEGELGFPLVWHNPETKHACRMYVRNDIDFLDPANEPECFRWLREKLERMHAVFGPRVRNLGRE